MKYKVGDKVRVVNGNGHSFKIGEVVDVLGRPRELCAKYPYICSNNALEQYLREDQIEPILSSGLTTTDLEKFCKLKEADYLEHFETDRCTIMIRVVVSKEYSPQEIASFLNIQSNQ